MTAIARKINTYCNDLQELINNACHLWTLHNEYRYQPHINQNILDNVANELNALLDYIMSHRQSAWEILLANAGTRGADVFIMAMVAFRSQDIRNIQRATEWGLQNDETFAELTSALAWLPDDIAHAWINQFFIEKNLDHKHIAMTTCRLRKHNPGIHLDHIIAREDCRAHAKLYACCLRAIGEFKRHDLAAELALATHHVNPAIAFWALHSKALLGEKDQLCAFKPYVLTPNPVQTEALVIAFTLLPLSIANRWIQELIPNNKRLAIQACGLLGDSANIEWLIEQMSNPEFARVAGEAFYLITGLDLIDEKLAADRPADGASASPTSDEYLPWPNTFQVKRIWRLYTDKFERGNRYRWGGLIQSLSHYSPSGQRYLQHQKFLLALTP